MYTLSPIVKLTPSVLPTPSNSALRFQFPTRSVEVTELLVHEENVMLTIALKMIIKLVLIFLIVIFFSWQKFLFGKQKKS
jgi:hypothetical protein